MYILKIFALCFTLTACINSPSTTVVENTLQDSTTQKVETAPNKSFSTNNKLPPDYKAPSPSIDSIYTQKHLIDLLNNWNKAINQQDLNTLSKIYASEITYYTKTISKKQFLSKKEKHFLKSPDYQQKISSIDIAYSEDNANIIRCSFLKSFNRNGKQDTVYSLIEFGSRQASLVITKESDQISEWQKAKKAPAKMELPRGEHYFSYDYLQDRRTDDVTAWDFISCSHSLFIDNSTEEIKLSYSTNYGPGSYYTFFIKNVQISNGILSFDGDAVDSSQEDDWLSRMEEGDTIPASHFKLYQFKILDFHTLVELNEDYHNATYYHRNSYTRPKEHQ